MLLHPPFVLLSDIKGILYGDDGLHVVVWLPYLTEKTPVVGAERWTNPRVAWPAGPSGHDTTKGWFGLEA